jgi:hypothetical protein
VRPQLGLWYFGIWRFWPTMKSNPLTPQEAFISRVGLFRMYFHLTARVAIGMSAA